MANVILSLNEQSKNITVLLDQKDQMVFSLGDAQLVYTDFKWESPNPASGFVGYNSTTGKYHTAPVDNEVTAESEHLVTSKAVFKFVEEISENMGGDIPEHVQKITEADIQNWNNKADSGEIPHSTSGLINDGDGSSPFATEDFVEKNGGKIDSISINGTKQPIDNNKNVDIELPSNIAQTDKNNNFTAGQTINGTLTVNGDIVQNGESYETHAEQVYTKNDTIILREGAVDGLSENQYAGFEAEKYDGTNTGVLVFGADGVARVGDKGNEQPLLTRKESEDLADGDVLVWNSKTNRADGSNNYFNKDSIVLTLKENGAYTLTINK